MALSHHLPSGQPDVVLPGVRHSGLDRCLAFYVQRLRWAGLLASLTAAWLPNAHADGVSTLQRFLKDTQTGRAHFTQTVTPPESRAASAAAPSRGKVSTGTFEFSRPNRFRFEYLKPYPQSLVADGQQVWMYDPDLAQASSRPIAQVLGSTPAALLAGNQIERDFHLKAAPSSDGLEWVHARPKAKDGAFTEVRVAFKGRQLARLEITDNFGQVSRLVFDQYETGVTFRPDHFKFVPPPGTELLKP